MRCAAILALLMVLPGPAFAAGLAVTQANIPVGLDFTGVHQVIFGTVDGPRPAALEIIVEGPPQTLRVSYMVQHFGIWVKATAGDLVKVPSAVWLLTDQPIADQSLLAEAVAIPATPDLKAEILVNRQRSKLYALRPLAVQWLSETLFRAEVALPNRVALGTYTVTARWTAASGPTEVSTHFNVEETGVTGTLSVLARSNGWAYGALSITLAIALGWLTGVMFPRRR